MDCVTSIDDSCSYSTIDYVRIDRTLHMDAIITIAEQDGVTIKQLQEGVQKAQARLTREIERGSEYKALNAQLQRENDALRDTLLKERRRYDALECAVTGSLRDKRHIRTPCIQHYHNIDTMVTRFHNDGFIALEDVFSPHYIDFLRQLSCLRFEELMIILKNKSRSSSSSSSLGIGVKEGFKEIVQRHLNRFEMPFGMSSCEFTAMALEPTLLRLVHAILGIDAEVINRSLLVSLPGSQDQAWHSDGPHLDITQHLPCHCLNVFIPLKDITIEDGPTEIRPGSQYLTRDLAPQFLKALAKKKLRKPVAPLLKSGSLLMFDYRALHRGLANTSSSPRSVFVLTFAKKGFRDVLNFPRRSISEEG